MPLPSSAGESKTLYKREVRQPWSKETNSLAQRQTSSSHVPQTQASSFCMTVTSLVWQVSNRDETHFFFHSLCVPLSKGCYQMPYEKRSSCLKLSCWGGGIENKKQSKGREPGFNLPPPENGDSEQTQSWREERQASAWAI